MNFLDESKNFMAKIVSGSPDQRVKSLIGNSFEPKHQTAAENFVNFLHPLGVLDRDGKPGTGPGAATRNREDAKACSFEKVCAAAENFDEIYGHLAPHCASALSPECTPEEVSALRQELKDHWQGKYDEEIDVVLVYYLVNDRDMHPDEARGLVGLADASGWARYV